MDEPTNSTPVIKTLDFEDNLPGYLEFLVFCNWINIRVLNKPIMTLETLIGVSENPVIKVLSLKLTRAKVHLNRSFD